MRFWSVRVLDALAVVALFIAGTVYLTGGFREWTPLGRISVTSWVRPVVLAILALAIRHAFVPRPTILTRLNAMRRRVWEADAVRAALPVALGTRAAVLVVGFLAVVLIGYRPDVALPWRIYDNEWFNLPARWDTGWYIGIATEGYRWVPARDSVQQNIAFFPLYPMLMRYGSLFLAREVMWTGVLISWAAFLWALVYLYRFTRDRFGGDAAQASIAMLACYPFALYFSTAYTESLFLLTIVAACYHFERGELWKAGIWGLLAGLCRPNGCLLSIPLALIAVRPLWPAKWWALGWRDWARVADRIAVAALPGIGMLCYSTYIYFLTGNPLQWAEQNASWGRVYRGLDMLFAEQAAMLGDEGLYSYASTRTLDALYASTVIFIAATVWPVFRRIGLPYAVLVAVNVLPPLLMGGFLSIGRVTSVLFPSFVWLGAVVPATHRAGWFAVFAMLQAICAAAFFTWRPLF